MGLTCNENLIGTKILREDLWVDFQIHSRTDIILYTEKEKNKEFHDLTLGVG